MAPSMCCSSVRRSRVVRKRSAWRAAIVRMRLGEVSGPARVVVPHRALVAAAFQARLWVPDVRTGGERCLVQRFDASPTLLVLGALATVLAAGTLVVAEDEDPARVAERERATLAALAPEGLVALGGARRADRSTLRAVLVDAGDASPAAAVPWDAAARLARASGGARVAGFTAAVGVLPTHAHPV